MTTTPAGWYPDPGGSGAARWWDGTAWGDQLQAVPQPVVQPAAQPWGATSLPAAPDTYAKRNTASLIALALAVVCVLIAVTTGYVVFALVPAFVAITAVQKKEPLAWPALGVAVALVIWRFVA